MKLKKYNIVDALEAIIDYRGRTPNKSETGIPTLSAKSVKMGYIDYDQCYFISPKEYESFMVRGFPRKGDVLVTTEAPLGVVAQLDRDDVAIAQRLLTIRGKKGVLDNAFLFYYLQSSAGQQRLIARQSGSTVMGIRQEEFRKIEIEIPSFQIQQQIASVLSNLDRKIALNRAINRNLEALAKQLYDYWFVQFDFPDENGRPYKSSGGKMVWNEELKREVPERWTVSSLVELGYFKNGINYSKDEIGDKDYKIVNVRNISSSSIFIDNSDLDVLTLKRNSGDNYLVKESDILIARSGVPGATRLLREVENNIIYCGFIICYTISDLDNKPILFYTLKQLESVTKSQSNGSILSNISQDVLKQLNVVLPDLSVKGLFNEKINKMFSLIQKNQREIDYLTKQRDELLPLLMNGQVTIE